MDKLTKQEVLDIQQEVDDNNEQIKWWEEEVDHLKKKIVIKETYIEKYRRDNKKLQGLLDFNLYLKQNGK